MESRENPIMGRKVFFINPPMGFDVSVIKKLREQEYEVYEVPDFRVLKSILRLDNNKNALCFINIDSGPSVKEWYNFIKSFQLDETLSTIFMGVMSGYANTGERGKFLLNLQLPGGFIPLNQAPERLLKHLTGILDINGAKGRRQYIRLTSNNLDDISGYMTYSDNLFSFTIENISAVGFACTYNVNKVDIFQKNTLINSISITLVKKAICCSVVVFDTRIVNGKGFSVMLFKDLLPEDRKVIKNYVFMHLDMVLGVEIDNAFPDYTDYSVDIVEEGNPDYEIPAEKPLQKIGDVDIPADVEDLEELPDDFDQVQDIDQI